MVNKIFDTLTLPAILMLFMKKKLLSNFLSIYNKVPSDKKTAKNQREDNHQIRTVGAEVTRRQVVNSGATMTSTNNLHLPTPMIPQPKIDATDRRQIEAQNDDKSHTTKATLDDIKHTARKEKMKKEQKALDRCPIRTNTGGLVSKTFIFVI